MIDWDDVGDAGMITAAGADGTGCGCALTIFGLLIMLALAYFAFSNSNECAQKTCPSGGQPKLMEHDCLCVERAR